MNHNLKLYIYLCFLLFTYSLYVSCSNFNSNNKVFKLLDPKAQGIDYVNKLTYTEDFNTYVFRSFYNGAGVGLADFNNDGNLDIFFSGNQTMNALYLGDGKFNFSDVSDISGITSPHSWSTGISVLDIKNRLEGILIEERIKFDDESLFLIAEGSDGSLRDGLQILDRLINFCDNDISIEKVSKNLNIIGPEHYLQICDNIIKKNISEVLVKFDKIISNGFSEINFIIGLSNHFRNLFLSKNNNTLKLLETSEKLKNLHLEQSKKIDLDWIRKALKITNSFEINFKNVDNKRIHTELCLMQISSIEIEEKNISEKKNIYLNDDKPIIIGENKNGDINKKALEDSIPKGIPTTEDINEDEFKKKTTNLNIGVKEVSSYSLASVEKKRTFKSKKENDDILKSKILVNENNFSQGDLDKYWKIYYNIKIQNKEFNIASLLKLGKPIKINNDIKYNVMSDINKKELEDELPKLLKYIRNSLKNDFIEVKIDSKNLIKKNILFTPSEKFAKLIKINPSLEILRKKLDLDY